MTAERRSALAAAAGLAVGLAALTLTGRALPFPPDLRPAALVDWGRSVGPATVAFTGLRVAAAALFGWWALAGAAGVAARVAHRPRLVGTLDRLAPAFVRRVAESVVGLGLVGATLVPTVAAGAAPVPAAVITMADLGPAMTDLGPLTIPSAPAPPSPASTPPAAPADGATDTFRTWVVAPGDTLWHVAEATIAARLDRPPTAAEVSRALDELIALNVGRLAVPDDPGLVFPGQEFLLP